MHTVEQVIQAAFNHCVKRQALNARAGLQTSDTLWPNLGGRDALAIRHLPSAGEWVG